LEYSKDDTKLDPLRHLFKIKTWGTKWKRVINKTDEWAAWRWANVKIDKENLSLLKQIVHISKENMEDYNLAMFTPAVDFFKEHMNLKNTIPEHFFTSLLSNLSIEDLVTLCNLLSTEFMKLKKRFYAIIGKQAWVPQELRNKVLNHPVNRQMIGWTLKPLEAYNS
jgi:alpha-L-arabinofuranosidase